MPQGRTEYQYHPAWWGYYFFIGLGLALSVYMGQAVARAWIRPAPQTTNATLLVSTGISLFLAVGAVYLVLEMRRNKRRARLLILDEYGLRVPLYKGKPTERFIAFGKIRRIRWSGFIRPALVIEHSDGTEALLITFLRRDQVLELWSELADRVRWAAGPD